ncbi:MAG: nuclear transport factor 2 family protein [Oxalobacteraceae bacterium]|nr:MAG: nuclear transport factor 2 family protein [Oxalobacteraceae bacterium]
MNAVERLVAIEELEQLKAKYWYYLDHQDWDKWRDEVWSPDGELEVDAEAQFKVGPREEMIEVVRQSFIGMISVHQGHTPIIEITSDTTATGIWVMEDRLYRGRDHSLGPSCVLGFGHYHETYVKIETGWRIRTSKLTRLRAYNQSTF